MRFIDYFNAHANLSHAFLHPGGRTASDELLGYIPRLDAKDQILELGCGTGSTAKLLLERFPCRYTGIDASPVMIKRASESLKKYGQRSTLLDCDIQKKELPLPSESVSLVVAESVLAIVDPTVIIPEVHRVLRRGGYLAWNDRIWKESATREEINSTNELSKKLFGFHAAPVQPATSNDWQEFIQRQGFRILVAKKIIPGARSENKHSTLISRSLRILFHPLSFIMLLKDHSTHKKYFSLWEQMENWIFIAQKN